MCLLIKVGFEKRKKKDNTARLGPLNLLWQNWSNSMLLPVWGKERERGKRQREGEREITKRHLQIYEQSILTTKLNRALKIRPRKVSRKWKE